MFGSFPSLRDASTARSVRGRACRIRRDILQRFQSRTPLLPPLLNEIEDPPGTLDIVLKHLDDDILHISNTKRLTRPEIKHMAKMVLRALNVLHSDGFVHTGTFHPLCSLLASNNRLFIDIIPLK